MIKKKKCEWTNKKQKVGGEAEWMEYKNWFAIWFWLDWFQLVCNRDNLILMCLLTPHQDKIGRRVREGEYEFAGENENSMFFVRGYTESI